MSAGQEGAEITFGPFHLLPTAKQLWRNGTQIEIRPLPLAVLLYLAQHPEQVVTKEELLAAIWAGTYVSPIVIRVCVREIRQALADDVKHPRYLETIGRQGYRFIGSRQPPSARMSEQGPVLSQETAVTGLGPLTRYFVGREQELAQLHEGVAQARRGQRRVILVSGEAGIGKSTVINHFVSQLRAHEHVWVGLGQCVDTYGQGEAYGPLLEALSRVGREQGASRVAAVLEQHAPTWLIQLPTLLTAAERDTLQRHVVGATPERMLRELSAALEVLTAEQLGILVLDDVHWSDAATLAWVAAWARRPEPAQLLLIATYRPTDVIVQRHPLRGVVQELRAHGLCQELRLEFLTAAEVAAYVRLRLANSPAATTLAAHLYQRTDGNPLFIEASLEALIHQQVVVEEAGHWRLQRDLASVESTVPEDLRQLLTRQVEVLRPEEQRVLEVASVVGMTFTAAEVAAGCKQEEEAIETLCDQLVQRGQVLEAQEDAEGPDGTLSARYGFYHALYQSVLYERLGRSQRRRLHRLVGEQIEAASQGQESAVAGLLAAQFTQGRAFEKAVRYHQLAAEEALRRSAYQEVIQHSRHGLALLQRLPGTRDCARQELALRTLCSTALTAAQGFAAETLSEHLQRADVLCQEVGDTTTLVPVLVMLGRLYYTCGARELAQGLMKREFRLLEGIQDPLSVIQLSAQLCTLETFAGFHDRAEVHYARVVEFNNPTDDAILLRSFGGDPLTVAAASASVALWLSGQPEQASRRLAQGLTRAEILGHPLTLTNSLFYGVVVRLGRGELDKAQQLLQRLLVLTQEQEFAFYHAIGVLLQGCLAMQLGQTEDGIATITEGLRQYRATGARIYLPYFLSFLAVGYWQQGRIEDGLQVITEALRLTETNFDVFWQAELYRLKGELTLHSQDKSRQVKFGV